MLFHDAEIKIVDSPPMAPIGTPTHRMKRIPSLNMVSAWSAEEDINRSPLLEGLKEEKTNLAMDHTLLERIVIGYHKHEKRLLHTLLKLVLHIQFISVFESLFFFLYVSTLEDNGLESTVNTFINGAVGACQNMTTLELDFINLYLGPYVNRTEITWEASQHVAERTAWNTHVMNQSWIYVGGLTGLFLLLLVYAKLRKIEWEWDGILVENAIMVGLLAVYEIIFFNTIIFHYKPITSSEISKNAVDQLHDSCGLF
jgi:hypothetical protein